MKPDRTFLISSIHQMTFLNYIKFVIPQFSGSKIVECWVETDCFKSDMEENEIRESERLLSLDKEKGLSSIFNWFDTTTPFTCPLNIPAENVSEFGCLKNIDQRSSMLKNLYFFCVSEIIKCSVGHIKYYEESQDCFSATIISLSENTYIVCDSPSILINLQSSLLLP